MYVIHYFEVNTRGYFHETKSREIELVFTNKIMNTRLIHRLSKIQNISLENKIHFRRNFHEFRSRRKMDLVKKSLKDIWLRLSHRHIMYKLWNAAVTRRKLTPTYRWNNFRNSPETKSINNTQNKILLIIFKIAKTTLFFRCFFFGYFPGKKITKKNSPVTSQSATGNFA